MNRRVKVVLVLVGLAVALAVGLAAIIETDEEAIERVTNSCRNAFLERDAEAILAHLTTDAVYVQRTREEPLSSEVKRRLEQDRRRVDNVSLSLREIEVDGDDARATWRVMVRLDRTEGFPMFRFDARVDYRREADGWKIRRAELASP